MRSACSVGVVAALGWHLLALVAMAAELTPVELGAKYEVFALNPESGDLVAVNAESSTITLFRSDFLTGKSKEKVGPVRVGAAPITPLFIAYKKYKARGVFAVAGKADGNIYLHDAVDLSLIRKVPIAARDISSLAGAPPQDNPFIYYSYGDSFDGHVGRINLARLVDEGTIANGMRECAVSATGTLLYGVGRSGEGARCVRIVEGGGADGKPRVEDVSQSDRTGGHCVADPYEFQTAVDRNVMTSDLRTRLATLKFPVQAFFGRRPVIVGQAEDSIMVASYNSFELLARVELPRVFRTTNRNARNNDGEQARRFGRQAYQLQVLADEAHGRIVAVREANAAVVALDELGLPEEPLLVAHLEGPRQLTVNKEATIKVVKPDARVNWQIADPPEGLKTVGDSLVWTPSAEQVGPLQLQITLTHGELKKSCAETIEVAFPFLQLPFQPEGLAASNDGKKAVAWSSLVPREKAPGVLQIDQRSTQVAVMDLEKFCVLTTVTLPFRASTAAIDEKLVYVAAAENNYMQVFPLADPTKRKQVVADEPIVKIQPVNAKLVLVGTQVGRTLRLVLPDLTRAAPPGSTAADPPGTGRMYPRIQNPDDAFDLPALNLRRVPNGWIIDGVVYDADASKPTMLLAPPSFFPLYDPEIRDHQGLGYGMAGDEGRYRNAQGFTLDGGQRTTLNHDSLPLKIIAEVSTRQAGARGDTQEQTITLTLCDVVRGAAQEIIKLAKSKVQSAERSHYGGGPLLASAGKAVLLTVQDRLFRYVPPELDSAKFPRPLRFELTQTAFAVETKGPTRLKHKLIGAKAPVQFAFTRSRKELTLDVNTGDVTVDGGGLIAAAEKYFANEPFALNSLSQIAGIGDHFSASPEKTLQDYVTATSPQFQQIVGRKPTGIPLILPIGLRAVDANDRIGELTYFVIVEVPVAPLAKKMKEHQEAQAGPKVEEVATERPSRPQNSKKTATAAGGQDRISELERRMEAIEGKLDLLTRLLSEQLGKKEDRAK